MDRFKQLEESMLLGSQPIEQDLQQAKLQSIKTVIDFRLSSETLMPNAMLASHNGLGCEYPVK